MSHFVTEADPEFDNQYRIIELSEDGDRDGTIAGWTTGTDAWDNAETVAGYLNEFGHQPAHAIADALGYTVAREF